MQGGSGRSIEALVLSLRLAQALRGGKGLGLVTLSRRRRVLLSSAVVEGGERRHRRRRALRREEEAGDRSDEG